MEREAGEKNFPIWLLGDSNPQKWQDDLDYPFDPRHPVVHNIWTSVIDIIQDKLYRFNKSRIDSKKIFVRNAIENKDNKPKDNEVEWQKSEVKEELMVFRELVLKYKPLILISFGSFSFEFTQRSLSPGTERSRFKYWNTANLGKMFNERLNNFDLSTTNVLPLLHRSISGGRFRESHKGFCCCEGKPNYFNYVGNSIAEKLIIYHDKMDIWI